MTAQELLDKDGFLVFSCWEKHKIGDVVQSDSSNVAGNQDLVVIGDISAFEAFALAAKNRVRLFESKYYYRVIAE